MKVKPPILTLLIFLALSLAYSPAFSQSITELKLDPGLLIALKECRNITNHIGHDLYPGWDFQKTPVLFYRPNVQELLINFPHRPDGFVTYEGFSPLGTEVIYARNDSTLFTIDDQNTSTEIDGIPVLVVADPYSSMRNQVQNVLLQRSKEFAETWLHDWSFIPRPYDELTLILHESFHVYQSQMAPEKAANEMAVSQYPLLDPVNNALYVLEGRILRDALLSTSSETKREKIKQFVAVRSYRQSLLDSNSVEYENLNEFVEGTAKYVEYKFLLAAEEVVPVPEMYYQTGFNGYQGALRQEFENRVENMVNVVAVNDDRFGNKFGSGPLRFKLYDLGACQAILLDDVMPGWKEKIFTDGVYLGDLLAQSVALSESEKNQHLAQAKAEYKYDDAYNSKLQFEKDGRAYIQKQLDAILLTDKTLVKVWYGAIAEKIGVAYTPFGVTQISKRSSIYDLVPILVQFNNESSLELKQITPVLIDRDQKLIAFAIAASGEELKPESAGKLDAAEFTLSAPAWDITRDGRIVEIRLR